MYILRTPPGPTPTEYKVIHARAKASLLSQSASGPSAGADFSEAAIDAETAHAIEHAWGTMALRARWPDREHALAQTKLDGVRYTFDYRGDNVYGQGATVSPDSGTCTATLTEIGELLGKFADERDFHKRAIFRDALLEKSRRLAERLK
jgi:hypothetical protein